VGPVLQNIRKAHRTSPRRVVGSIHNSACCEGDPGLAVAGISEGRAAVTLRDGVAVSLDGVENVNAEALGVILASAIPVYIAQRVASDAVSIGDTT
jgi:hypothetical protein